MLVGRCRFAECFEQDQRGADMRLRGPRPVRVVAEMTTIHHQRGLVVPIAPQLIAQRQRAVGCQNAPRRCGVEGKVFLRCLGESTLRHGVGDGRTGCFARSGSVIKTETATLAAIRAEVMNGTPRGFGASPSGRIISGSLASPAYNPSTWPR